MNRRQFFGLSIGAALGAFVPKVFDPPKSIPCSDDVTFLGPVDFPELRFRPVERYNIFAPGMEYSFDKETWFPLEGDVLLPPPNEEPVICFRYEDYVAECSDRSDEVRELWVNGVLV